MTVIRLTGNTLTLNSTASVIPLANTYLANGTSGATMCYIYNSNTTTVANVWVSNTEGSFVFGLPPSTEIILSKVSTDVVNTAAAGVYASPIARATS
jgi:hypothetical protein